MGLDRPATWWARQCMTCRKMLMCMESLCMLPPLTYTRRQRLQAITRDYKGLGVVDRGRITRDLLLWKTKEGLQGTCWCGQRKE
eukprot:356556-Chlamydomonas_euryale.AAC.3